MILNQTIAVLGGDNRQLALAEYFLKERVKVHAFGLPKEQLSSQIACFKHWKDAVKGVGLVILPLPASPDGRRLHLPLATGEEAPLLSDVFAALPTIPVAAGKCSPAVKALAAEHGVRLFDYFDCEELQLKNALPTAEGAVSILMREIPRTVKGLPVAVTGYGRVAGR